MAGDPTTGLAYITPAKYLFQNIVLHLDCEVQFPPTCHVVSTPPSMDNNRDIERCPSIASTNEVRTKGKGTDLAFPQEQKIGESSEYLLSLALRDREAKSEITDRPPLPGPNSPPPRNQIASIHNFLKWIHDHTLYSIIDLDTEETTPFVPLDDARAYLAEGNPARLADILDELFLSQHLQVDYTTILKQYVAIFCILISMEKESFIQHFVDYDLNDQKLPFDPSHKPLGFPRGTGAGGLYGLFCETQWKYCVPLFKKNMTTRFRMDQILPIASSKKVADGSNGSVVRAIELHSFSNRLADSTKVCNSENCP